MTDGRPLSLLPSTRVGLSPLISPGLIGPGSISPAPGAGSNASGSQRNARIPFAAIVDGGARFFVRVPGAGAIVVDNVDMSPLIDRRQLSMARSFFGNQSYVESHVSGAYFSADTDMTPGGLGVMTARVLSNQWHGDFQGFPFVDRLADSLSGSNKTLPYTMNRYGGNLGGPIGKRGTYFFAGLTDLRQLVGENLVGYVPTPAFLEYTKTTEPGLIPLLAAFPAGVSPLSGSIDSMIFRGVGDSIFDEDAAQLRIDQDFPQGGHGASRDTVFLHANLDVAKSNAPYSGGEGFLNDILIRRCRPIAGVIGWTHALSASALEDLRVSYVRGTMETQHAGPNSSPYTVMVSGFSVLDGFQTTAGTSDAYAAQDSVAWVHGRQTLTAGGELRRLDLNLRVSDMGRVAYSTMGGFAANQVSWAIYRQAVPGNTLEEMQAVGWVQLSRSLRNNLVVGAGLRYEFYNHPRETHSKAIPFDFATCGEQGFCAPGASFNQENLLNFDPRVSLAWAPEHGPGWLRSNLVIRAGGGIYHAAGLLSDQSQPIYNEVQNFALSSASQTNLSYPIAPFLLGDMAGIGSARGMSRRRLDPYGEEWSFSVQAQLPGNWMATGTYFGALGMHLPASNYENLIDPSTDLRPDRALGQIHFLDNTGSSSVNAISFSAAHNLSTRLQLLSSFTLAHEIDDGAASDIGADPPENPACPRCERASGDQDVRVSETATTVYQLPIGKNRPTHFENRFLNGLASDWDVANSFYARTGLPVNVIVDRLPTDVATGYTIAQRPDRVPGIAIRPPNGPTLREWLNPAAFSAVSGLYGDTPRNVARGPGHWSVNSGLRRTVFLPRGFRLGASATLQNILNHAQYGQPLADWSTVQFGEIIDPANPGRLGANGGRLLILGLDIAR